MLRRCLSWRLGRSSSLLLLLRIRPPSIRRIIRLSMRRPVLRMILGIVPLIVPIFITIGPWMRRTPTKLLLTIIRRTI
jgi:hypothetical protein